MFQLDDKTLRYFRLVFAIVCLLACPLAGAGDATSSASVSRSSGGGANFDPGETEPDPEPLVFDDPRNFDPGETEPDPEPFRRRYGPIEADPYG